MQLNEAYLTAVAATSIGFIGFASLIGVFRKKPDSVLSPPETAGLHLIVEHCLAALFLSLLPLALLQYSTLYPTLADSSVRISSGFAACFFARQIWMVVAKLRLGIKPRRRFHIFIFFIPTTAFFLWLLIYNAVIANHAAHLYLGQLWLFGAAGWQFLHFVFPPE